MRERKKREESELIERRERELRERKERERERERQTDQTCTERIREKERIYALG